jgi:hypothetical protein
LDRQNNLELLAYILIYFLHSSLLWQGSGHQEAREDSMLKLKQRITRHDLCHSFPVEFCKFLEYMQSLSSDDTPDYNHLYDLFDGLLSQVDNLFDWDVGSGQSDGEGRVCGAAGTYNKSHKHRIR